MNEFVSGLKAKYNYSDELCDYLNKVIPALITYYGEENKETILSALSNCEIHIQAQNENGNDYLNQYFGTQKDWEMPALGGAFYHNELSVKDNMVYAKPIIYMKTEYFRQYKPFDFSNDEKLSGLTHEICHLIKGYGKLKIVDGKVVDSTGLSKDIYEYDAETNSLKSVRSDNTGIEEAINSHDEAQVMTIMTGVKHELGAYKGMSKLATDLMQHSDIAKAIRNSQFKGDDTWREYLGEEMSKSLIDNFEIMVQAMYAPISVISDDKKRAELIEGVNKARDNISSVISNYTSTETLESFMEARTVADKKTIEVIQQLKIAQQMQQPMIDETQHKSL